MSNVYRRPCLTPSIRSVDRALTILEQIAKARRGMSLSEFGRRLGIPKSTTHCLALTLERRGYIARNPVTNRYSASSKLRNLGEATACGMLLRQKSAPALQALVRKTGLTVHLAIMDHGTAVIIDRIEAHGNPRLATWVGRRLDLHCSAVGKAILAYLPEEELESLIKCHGLIRYNENTLTSINRLAAEVTAIRRLGYAFEDEEGEIGFRCIGAPIFARPNVVVAAVSVSGTTQQIHEDNLERYAKLVSIAAKQISQSLVRDPLVVNCPETLTN